jgi:hypothetical protein
MKTIRTKVYQFNELNDKAKSYAIEQERNDYQQHGEPLYFFEEYCKDRAAEEGFNDCQFQWSLGYCQGDGLSFSCNDFDLKKFLTENTRLSRFINVYAANLKVEIKGNTGRYCFASRSDVDLYLENYKKDYPNFESLIPHLLECLEGKYLALCKELQETGYKWIEAEDEESAIIDRIEANEYDFTADGKRFHQ